MLTMPTALRFEYKLICTASGFSGEGPSYSDLQQRFLQTLTTWYNELLQTQDINTFQFKIEGIDVKEFTMPKI